jgi:starch-binding outer membrane protein, SusD/RagB family
MKAIRAITAAAVLLVSGACSDLIVPDYNNPSLEDLQNNPTPSKIAQAAQGLLVGSRAQQGTQNGYVSLLGILGRESYNFDPADPRFIVEMLIGPLDGGSPAFGGNLFGAPYANIRNANVLLAAIDAVAGLSAEQKSATKGFAHTIQALDYLSVINTRDDLGAPLDVSTSPTGPPAPIVSKAEIFAFISKLLDDGLGELQAGGAAFPFTLSPGYAEAATPSAFVRFNRALKARVEAYRANYPLVITALNGSFINPSASLTLGVYHTFSTGSGDLQNLLFDPTGRAILAHPSIRADAEHKPDGSLDNRALAKTALVTARTVQDVTADAVFTIYNSNVAPVPVIRNEELILLRAEARWFTGDAGGALSDINFVRTTSGGLAARGAFANATDFLNELLMQRRYSLMFEGGHRWIDMRRFGRLNQLPKALSTHNIHSRFPFPEGECLARGAEATPGCT